jgi:hypothetical protein
LKFISHAWGANASLLSPAILALFGDDLGT